MEHQSIITAIDAEITRMEQVRSYWLKAAT